MLMVCDGGSMLMAFGGLGLGTVGWDGGVGLGDSGAKGCRNSARMANVSNTMLSRCYYARRADSQL